MAESMTIAELSKRVGMTPRNIRAYQSKRLLHPPELRGRVAHYSGAHVARLQLIASLQREGFTLAAIKRLLETPDSYSRIVADRRRRFRDGQSDITTGVPVAPERIREFGADLVERLLACGVAWHEDGLLHIHTVLVGVGRTLAQLGMPPAAQAGILVEAAEAGRTLGVALRSRLVEAFPDAAKEGGRVTDLARVAVQLHAAAFELALAQAAGGGDRPESPAVSPSPAAPGSAAPSPAAPGSAAPGSAAPSPAAPGSAAPG
ncbi:MAG: MerR family transcriptional regulator, partial [Actinomycetes bacterium]